MVDEKTTDSTPEQPKKPVQDSGSSNLNNSGSEKPNSNQDNGPMSLIVFKHATNLSDMEYVGFKAELKADDLDKFSKIDLDTKLQAYRDKPAFNQKEEVDYVN